jgi:hypothetical protein
MTNALDDQLLRGCRQELAQVLAQLPTDEAEELRGQILAHLDDAVPPGASSEQVADVIRRLGPPSELLPARPTVRDGVLRRAIRRIRRMRRRNLAVLVAAIATGGAGIGYLLDLCLVSLAHSVEWHAGVVVPCRRSTQLHDHRR